MTSPTNLFSDLPGHAEAEIFSSLLHSPGCRVERIVSYGQRGPEDFW